MGTFDELDARKHEVKKVSQFLNELLPYEEGDPDQPTDPNIIHAIFRTAMALD